MVNAATLRATIRRIAWAGVASVGLLVLLAAAGAIWLGELASLSGLNRITLSLVALVIAGLLLMLAAHWAEQALVGWTLLRHARRVGDLPLADEAAHGQTASTASHASPMSAPSPASVGSASALASPTDLGISLTERQLITRLPGLALLVQTLSEGALTDWLLLLGHQADGAGLPAADTVLATPELLSHWLARHPHIAPAEVVAVLQPASDGAASHPGRDAATPTWRLLPLSARRGVLWLEPVATSAADASESSQISEPLSAERERESIAYSVSHDLRAPIRVVEGFTRIVREDYGHLLDRIGNDHLDRVLGAAARMNTMIDALLALSRLSTQPLAREAVPLSRMAEQVIDELRAQAPMRQVQVLITPGLTAQGDPNLLRSVLDNLLGNAWKYSARRSEARIEFGSTRLSQLRPGIGAAQDLTVFYVRDNGAGFDMRFADRLFGAFQRLHSASDFAGTGVGLASVRRIVARHGGAIWAQAAVDQGACFYFDLG